MSAAASPPSPASGTRVKRHWQARLVFDVTATDYHVACSKLFALLMQAFAAVREEGEVHIHRPAYDLKPPHRNYRTIGRGVVMFPPPNEYGQKARFQIAEDILYFRSDNFRGDFSGEWYQGDWQSREEAWEWLRGLFSYWQTPDVMLVRIEESIINWN